MPINILMPALSPTMEKGNLAKWLKKEGEKVKPGDVIAEIETDKATMEVEAVDEGTLAKIVVPEGTADVPVNQLIAVLAGEGEDAKAAGAGRERGSRAEARRGAEGRSTEAPPAPQRPRRPKPPKPAPRPRQHPRAPATNGHARVFSSPLARRLAKEAGIDIARIAGTGPHGRVVARDVAAAKEGKGLKAPRRRAGALRRRRADRARAVATTRCARSTRKAPTRSSRTTTCAARSRSGSPPSTQTIPHFYLTIDCVIDKLIAAREEINASAPKDKEGKPAYKLSVNDFVIKALALALQRIPNANVSWTESGMLKHKHSDVGVAVAMPGGLITPIIRQRGDEIAVGHLQRDEGFRRARAGAQAQAARIPGRHHGGVEPRHVRHQGFHRGDQSAARHDPGGRRRRGAGDRAQRARSSPRM